MQVDHVQANRMAYNDAYMQLRTILCNHILFRDKMIRIAYLEVGRVYLEVFSRKKSDDITNIFLLGIHRDKSLFLHQHPPFGQLLLEPVL